MVTRPVIPKSLREQVGPSPGPVEIDVDGAALRIEPVPDVDLVERDGWLVIDAHDVVITDDDVRRLRTLIERHRRFTGSALAARVLDRWDALLPKFVKIVPVDYRRALIAMRAEAESAAKIAAAE